MTKQTAPGLTNDVGDVVELSIIAFEGGTPGVDRSRIGI